MGKRSIGRIARALAGATVLCVVLGTSPAGAYTFIDNAYPAQPFGCTNGLAFDMPHPRYFWCERWHLNSSGYSIHVKVYLDPSVTSNRPPGETINWASETASAFVRWNNVPARSPFLDQVSSLGASTNATVDGISIYTKIYRDGAVAYPDIAMTTTYTRCYASVTRTDYNTCPDLVTYDPNWLIAFKLDLAMWATFQTHAQNPVLPTIDGTYVLMHELGHSLGLGHTGFSSLMQPYYDRRTYTGITPTTGGGGDVQGLQVYYDPSFCVPCQH